MTVKELIAHLQTMPQDVQAKMFVRVPTTPPWGGVYAEQDPVYVQFSEVEGAPCVALMSEEAS